MKKEEYVILCEGRGDYLTGFGAAGEIRGGDREDAIKYTASGAKDAVEMLGEDKFSIEPAVGYEIECAF